MDQNQDTKQEVQAAVDIVKPIAEEVVSASTGIPVAEVDAGVKAGTGLFAFLRKLFGR